MSTKINLAEVLKSTKIIIVWDEITFVYKGGVEAIIRHVGYSWKLRGGVPVLLAAKLCSWSLEKSKMTTWKPEKIHVVTLSRHTEADKNASTLGPRYICCEIF